MANDVDILPTIPEKFRDSQILLDYVAEINTDLNYALDKIDGIEQLLDPYNVPRQYMQYLADLIGFKIMGMDTQTTDSLRQQLLRAIPWYKMKGTYQSIKVLAYWCGLSIQVVDMYTNNYVDFIDVPWFVGEEGENPTGLDSSYYKSPHMGLNIFLNRIVDIGSSPTHLWLTSMFNNLYTYVEQTRPVNVVPHYRIVATPQTYDDKSVVSMPESILTRVMDIWSSNRMFFDAGIAESSAAAEITFDNSKLFDYTPAGFPEQVTKFGIGIGNKGVTPANGFTLANSVYTGSITSSQFLSDRSVYEIVIPQNVIQNGISELVLLLDNGLTVALATTFPDIDKGNQYELKFIITVLKKGA